VAAKPVDGDSSALLKLANHASKLLREFTDLEPGQRYRMAELLAELEHVIAEFRRLRPPRPSAKGQRYEWCGCARFANSKSESTTNHSRRLERATMLIATNAKPESRDGNSSRFNTPRNASIPLLFIAAV
jgi:hypothetical protein